MTAHRLFSLDGKKALVIGGSRGLGRAICEGLAASGAEVAVGGRDNDAVHATVDAISAAGGRRAVAVIGDLGATDGAEFLVGEALRFHGGLDILVNAAGAIARGPVAGTEPEEFRNLIEINALGTLLACKAAAPSLAARRGAIVNIASTAGLVGMSERVAYAASKGAVVQITRSLAVELAPTGVRVNAVAPGPFAAGMAAQATPRWQAILKHRVPMHRSAEPGEIVGPVLFLASEAASFVTGVILPVDGGWLAS